ncbi:hypothetical protein [Veronia nyctiphanis]|uniref:hypothetical protein n=1 Tax=Veronia nyctiphanis TaxID=1278244 RepID=UPI001F3C74B0|nr:hypothetical protein [Veronia nyctiphanis]
MQWITNLPLKKKMLVLVIISIASLVSLTIYQSITLYDDLINERKSQLKDKIDIAINILEQMHEHSPSAEQHNEALEHLQG